MLILLQVQVIRTGEVCPTGHLDGEFRVVQHVEDVWDDCLLVHIDAEDLTLLVDTNDTVCRLVLGGDEDSLTANTVHVDTCTAFQVVQVNESILGDEIDNAVLLGDLHRHREVVLCLSREEYVYGFFGKDWIGSSVVNFDNVELKATVKVVISTLHK